MQRAPLAYWQIDLRNLLPWSGIKPFATDEEGGGKSLGLAKFQTALSSATHLIVSKHEPRKKAGDALIVSEPSLCLCPRRELRCGPHGSRHASPCSAEFCIPTENYDCRNGLKLHVAPRPTIAVSSSRSIGESETLVRRYSSHQII